MKRLLLFIPVLVVGVPLAVYLLVVLGASPAPNVPEPPAVVIAPKKTLPDQAGMDKLASDDPVAFLENCVRRYDRDVKSYNATLSKQERIDDTLYPPEVLQVRFREHPFSVWLHWLQGERKAKTVLYVQDANDNKILVHPGGLAGRLLFGKPLRLDVNSSLARGSGRYPLDQFGIEKGTLRTLAGWVAAQKQGTLHVEYLGKKKIEDVGGRLCWCFHRTYVQPDPVSKAADLTLYVDCKNWLQVGSIIKDKDGKLIGVYDFKDVQLNPTFAPGQFEPAAVSD